MCKELVFIYFLFSDNFKLRISTRPLKLMECELKKTKLKSLTYAAPQP